MNRVMVPPCSAPNRNWLDGLSSDAGLGDQSPRSSPPGLHQAQSNDRAKTEKRKNRQAREVTSGQPLEIAERACEVKPPDPPSRSNKTRHDPQIFAKAWRK